MFFLGNVPASTTLYLPFDTYDSNGASVTITGLAVTDVEIFKNGSVTQRASDNGYALLDTDGIDFDSTTGLHGFSIDLSDNSDASFYAAGSQYWVNVNAITVDSQTVRFTYYFRIVAAESSAGTPKADVSHWLGTAAATPTVAGVPEVDVTHWIGTAAATPTTAGVPEVDVTFWLGTAAATPTVGGVPEVDITHSLGTAWAATAGYARLDAVGSLAFTESYAADGATFTLAQALYEICQTLSEFAIASTTITVKKRDGTTTAATYTLDDATNPTSRTRAT